MTPRTTPIKVGPDGLGRMFILRPIATALGNVAKRIDPGVVGRLYVGLTVEQRAQFWEALETTVPEAWAAARRDLRRPLATPSEPTTQTLAGMAGHGPSAPQPTKREWYDGQKKSAN